MWEMPIYIKPNCAREPYLTKLVPSAHRQNTFGDNTYKHASVVVGPTSHGKDTFISSLDPSLLTDGKVIIGDGKTSCTKEFRYMQYKNQNLIGMNKGVLLNTVGLGDSELQLEDHQIVKEIYKEVIQHATSFNGGIDVFYFVASINDQPTALIERSLILMEAAFGRRIFNSSIIIATKGNKVSDQEDFENGWDALVELSEKYNIKGGVLDFRCQYQQTVKGKKLQKTPVTDEEKMSIEKDLNSAIQGLDYFDIFDILIQLKKEIDKKFNEMKQKSKIYQTEKQTVVKLERKWYTLFLFLHEITYIHEVQKVIFTQTDPKLIEQATQVVLEERTSEMGKKLANLGKNKIVTLRTNNI